MMELYNNNNNNNNNNNIQPPGFIGNYWVDSLHSSHPQTMSYLNNSSGNAAADTYIRNGQAPRINTDILIYSELQRLYPKNHIRITPASSCNILSFAATGHAKATPDPDANGTPFGPLEWINYLAPESRLNGGSGRLQNTILFGKYSVKWLDQEFTLYVVDGRDGTGYYPEVKNNYIIAHNPASADSLILAAGAYTAMLHDEIWVFDGGFWRKDANLWKSMQKASWDNVILDPEMKSSIIKGINRFFDNQDSYKRLKVPWKRGLIFHGPPGNGKTISVKATMNMLFNRIENIPTLYVRTLTRSVYRSVPTYFTRIKC
jgi:transitional endoplasmic reticulum ATPase